MKKNIKTKIFIFISTFVFLVIILLCFIFYNVIKNKNLNDVNNINNNLVEINNSSDNNSKNSEKPESNIIFSQNISNNIIIEQQNEIETYWNNYKDSNHWSENTKRYTLAYALKEDKYDNEEDYITETDQIIEYSLPNSNNGLFVSYSSISNILNVLKSEGLNIFYIDDSGMLKYQTSEYTLKTPLEQFLISIIDNPSTLYIIDVSFAYIDEDEGTKPVSIPIEIDYLGFCINNSQELLVYNMYNFNFETFIKGLQELTNKNIETE